MDLLGTESQSLASHISLLHIRNPGLKDIRQFFTSYMGDACPRPCNTHTDPHPKGTHRSKLWNPKSALLFAHLPPLTWILWQGCEPSYKDCRAALRTQQQVVQDVYEDMLLAVVEDVLKSRIDEALAILKNLEASSEAPSILLCTLVLWLCLHGQDLSLKQLQTYRNLSAERLKQGLRSAISSNDSTHPGELHCSETSIFNLNSLQ